MDDKTRRPVPAERAEVETVAIDYIKSNLFRTVSPSGLISSVTPQGEVQIGFFSERQAIPQRVVHELNPDGSLGEAIETIGRDAIVRELEINVTLDVETAKRLARRLDKMVEEATTKSQ